MKTRHGDKKREIMWDSSKPSSTEIVPVLTERNAHSIFTTNCSFACSDFLMYYIVRMKSISLELEQQKTVKLLHYNSIQPQLHYYSFPFDLMTFARNRKSDILTLTPFYLPKSLSLKLSLYLYISRNTHSFIYT